MKLYEAHGPHCQSSFQMLLACFIEIGTCNPICSCEELKHPSIRKANESVAQVS